MQLKCTLWPQRTDKLSHAPCTHISARCGLWVYILLCSAGFAMTEAVLMLAAILQQFSLSPGGAGGQFPAVDPRITLRPKDVFVTLSPR